MKNMKFANIRKLRNEMFASVYWTSSNMGLFQNSHSEIYSHFTSNTHSQLINNTDLKFLNNRK